MPTMIRPSNWRPNMIPREQDAKGSEQCGEQGGLVDSRLTDCDGPDSDDSSFDVRVEGIVSIAVGIGVVGIGKGVVGIGIGRGVRSPKASDRVYVLIWCWCWCRCHRCRESFVGPVGSGSGHAGRRRWVERCEGVAEVKSGRSNPIQFNCLHLHQVTGRGCAANQFRNY
jgi:hypothetical protein